MPRHEQRARKRAAIAEHRAAVAASFTRDRRTPLACALAAGFTRDGSETAPEPVLVVVERHAAEPATLRTGSLAPADAVGTIDERIGQTAGYHPRPSFGGRAPVASSPTGAALDTLASLRELRRERAAVAAQRAAGAILDDAGPYARATPVPEPTARVACAPVNVARYPARDEPPTVVHPVTVLVNAGPVGASCIDAASVPSPAPAPAAKRRRAKR